MGIQKPGRSAPETHKVSVSDLEDLISQGQYRAVLKAIGSGEGRLAKPKDILDAGAGVSDSGVQFRFLKAGLNAYLALAQVGGPVREAYYSEAKQLCSGLQKTSEPALSALGHFGTAILDLRDRNNSSAEENFSRTIELLDTAGAGVGEELKNEANQRRALVSREKTLESGSRTQRGAPSRQGSADAECNVARGLSDPLRNTPFGRFGWRHVHGKTAEDSSGGKIIWDQYDNSLWKKAREEGAVAAGGYRIYFDVDPASSHAEELSKLTQETANRLDIPVQYKILNVGDSSQSLLDPDTTKFVVNFASPEDAGKFYAVLQSNQEYGLIPSSSRIGYHGHRLDDKAELCTGFREERGSEEFWGGGKEGDNWVWQVSGERKTGMDYEAARKHMERVQRQNTNMLARFNTAYAGYSQHSV